MHIQVGGLWEQEGMMMMMIVIIILKRRTPHLPSALNPLCALSLYF